MVMNRDRFKQDALVERLRRDAQVLAETDSRPGMASADSWVEYSRQIRELVLNGDPTRFCRWGPIGPMFVKDAGYVKNELRFLRSRPDWKPRWRDALEETEVGRPPRYPWYRRSSGNLIHHAYHLARFEQITGFAVQEADLVLEFGGGYGSMCRLAHRLGFRGRYVIFDLPIVGLIQRYFLESLGIPVFDRAPVSGDESGVALLSDLKDLVLQFGRERGGGRSLFLATWSLSETPLSLRKELLALINGFDRYLIAYQESFEDINNLDYFEALKRSVPRPMEWWHEKITHLPGNAYLFGAREKGRQ
jgi:hypothetical protein